MDENKNIEERTSDGITKDDNFIVEEATEKKNKSFWLGVLIGLGGWIAHTALYIVVSFIVLIISGNGADMDYFGSWGGLTVIGVFFFIYGWEVLAIISGIVSKRKGAGAAVKFVAITVVILTFVVGGCTGLLN